jgi:predicted nuclease of predicted toxin-antitoxin system
MSLRVPANENIPRQLVETLEQAGCDVVWIRRSDPGISDQKVLARAIHEERILLTFDKDFGELAKAVPLPRQCGVILLRLPAPSPQRIGPALSALLLSRKDWAGQFSVVEPDRIRSRPLKEA